MTEPRIDVSIMAHPRRATMANALARRFSALPARVVLDPCPEGPQSTIRTARLAWRPWSAGTTHHLVLQDDVELHPDFEEQVAAATRAQPDSILSFFSEWGSFTSHALRVAALAGFSWVAQPDTYIGAQACLMPAAAARAFSAYLEAGSDETPDDHAIFAFAVEHDIRHLVSSPNLVDHDSGASLVGNGHQGPRRATAFVSGFRAPFPWWEREPLTTLRSIPVMHWTTASRARYEKPGRQGVRWNIAAPPRDRPSPLRSALLDRFDRVTSAPADPVFDTAVRDVVEVAADQIELAAALPGARPTTFGDRVADAAVRSMAPGCLRTLITSHSRSTRLPIVTDALVRFVGDYRRALAAETGS